MIRSSSRSLGPIFRLTFVVQLFVSFAFATSSLSESNSRYILGDQGDSCSKACINLGMNCNPHMETQDSTQLFSDLGINCTADPRKWWAHDQPSYVSDKSNENYGRCLGFAGVPGGVLCHKTSPSVRRLCRCDNPSKEALSFGTGGAHIDITQEEQMLFAHAVADGDVGVLTHFWITYHTEIDEGVIVRYYVDGESSASVKFTPSLAAGVGFYDKQAPWGTDLIGKGASEGSWFINIRAPFQKSIRVTIQHLKGTFDGVYVMVRGAVNVPIQLGGVTIPRNARLNLYSLNQHLQPYDWATLVDIPKGKDGLLFLVTMSAKSRTIGFLEGCVHLYTSAHPEFPGIILGTGTEDYFDSGYFFDGGQYHLPNAGFTHMVNKPGHIEWSAYRFHIQDPLQFSNGVQFVWRNSDIQDATGVKCMVSDLNGSSANEGTTEVSLSSYVWAYVWDHQLPQALQSNMV